jgi:hypothetical protein
MVSSPASLFSQLNWSVRASMRGVTTEYRPTDETSGVVLAHHARPLPPMVLQASVGALRYTFDLCRVEGTVSVLSVEDDGKLSRFGVRWFPR